MACLGAEAWGRGPTHRLRADGVDAAARMARVVQDWPDRSRAPNLRLVKLVFASRAMSVIGLAAALAVAGVVPAEAQSREATALTARFSHASARVGTSSTLSGALAPKLYHRRIYLQRYDAGRWRSLTSQRTNRAGRAAFAVRPARAGTFRYRLRFAGDSGARPSTSPVRRLIAYRISTAVTAGVTHPTVHVAVPTSLTGTLSPSLPSRRVYLQRYGATGWRDVSSKATSSVSRYAFTITPSVAGTAAYRIAYKGAVDAKPSVSPTRTLSVRAAASVNSSGLLGGNVNPTPPVGAAGRVTVVQHGALAVSFGLGTMPVVIRNNTASTRTDIEITASVRDGAGRLVATGSGDRSVPATLTSGGVGLAEVEFDNPGAIPAGATYTFTVTASAPSALGNLTLDVTEANHVGDTIVGSATNTTGRTASGPYRVNVFCFSGSVVAASTFTYADQDGDVPNGATVVFSVDVTGLACESYLAGVTGWNF